ncbi:hypothetical protein C8F01DRAFT_1264828 [Mycena amicta]|nr:hypothetical protein C8F01DRAFT_1264828 [Mycena amicta]
MDAAHVQTVIAAAGVDNFRSYVSEKLPSALVQLGLYTIENAHTWLKMDEFLAWIAHRSQQQSSTNPLPAASLPPPPNSISTPSTVPFTVPSNPTGLATPSAGSLTQTRVPSLADQHQPAPSTSRTTARDRKRKRRTSNADSDSDSDSSVAAKVAKPGRGRAKGKARAKRSKRDDATRTIDISREVAVRELRRIDTVPACWDIPTEGDKVAYLWDLSEYDGKWKDSDSMITIFKKASQDSWGEGSAGAVKRDKATKVIALDGTLCQVAHHYCQGAYVCDQMDPELLDEDYTRYSSDTDEMKRFFERSCDVNQLQTSCAAIKAASERNVPEKMALVMSAMAPQRTAAVNADGKEGFVGCSNYSPGELSHRFIPIPRDVPEAMTAELFQNNGVFLSGIGLGSQYGHCANIQPGRNGAKGSKLCRYTTVDDDGRVIQGKLVHRRCDAEVTIYAPIDRSIRKAIVILENGHSHPEFPRTKPSDEGKAIVNQAIQERGTTGLTVTKLGLGSTTLAKDPAFLNARQTRKLISDAKKITNKHGLGIEGQSAAEEAVYIWKVASELDEEIIVTMLEGLAKRIHRSRYTVHDNTYCRVHGEWKEWELVIWDDRLNMRLAIARVYTKHETLVVFKKVWSSVFECLERVTGAKPKIKCVDGAGLLSIALDGNKPQANALGEYLVSRNQPHLSGVFETDPKLMLTYVLRTCTFHLNRKFTEMAKVVGDEEMARIRRCQFVKTQAELDVLVRGYKESEHKIVREWIKDKESIPWFFPSINEHLSKIQTEDWYRTTHHTNLNESSHPFTNQHTGTNLPILEAIQTGYNLDVAMDEKAELAETSCVLPNHRNTEAHRDHSNIKRRQANLNAAIENASARAELENIDEEILQATQRTQELKERKKDLKRTSGVTQVKRRGEKNKLASQLPTEEELSGLTSSAVLTQPRTQVVDSPFGSLEFDTDGGLILDSDLEPRSLPPYSDSHLYSDDLLFSGGTSMYYY